ncbi:hypothetical protein AYO21_06520 [Fonsecaea monophora]|uniref:Choline monooxygenase, chloroplastic n=1 Tax=Fonsecaea monophora TaxID=254056 RepID=A0A177F633_9EURO|nr:hypothetical protein AYO21_06520 [Fonsecaea monophora]OAG39316.1 hypothetical protein AYO21_06520 [Fonsecaea monophora]
MTCTSNGVGTHGPISTTLPASWYREEGMYELEKRAIFSKQWLCVSHSLRFREIGEFVNFEIAGYKFFVIRDRQNELKGFLNICRHRAYPVIEKQSGQGGKVSVLACKYHGWSYGFSGNLAKAPRFETAENFDKSQYSLYSVHVRTDRLGFVWVNLDAANPPTIPWEDHFERVDEQPRQKDFSMDDFTFDHAWEMEGEYNWKVMVDNYNECYHCTTAHPGILATTKLDTYDVKGIKGWIEHYSEPLDSVEHKYGVQPTYFFPNAAILISDGITYLTRFAPKSATSLKLEYEVYRHKDCSDQDFDTMNPFFKQVEQEDLDLCNAVQRNLNMDTYVKGPLHPHNEKGVIYFKNLVRDVLYKHVNEEEQAGRKICPARRDDDNEEIAAEEAFCRLAGRSTPVPQDAPPSVQSLSTARKAARAQAKHRLFYTIDYVSRVSYFDARSEYRDFRGFFVLFWISLTIMVITTCLRNIKETGHPLRVEVYALLSRNVISLGLSDAAMVASTALSLPIQKLARGTNGVLRWRRAGIWIQSTFQALWLALWVSWPFLLGWTWTAQVFFALHTLTFLMKMHSYAFYNGHLSETERRLRALDKPETADLGRAVKYPSSPSRLRQMDSESSEEEKEDEQDLAQLRQDLATELTSPLGQVTYPQNLTLYNYADYILCPTLCYELEYPRTPKIRWDELFYKTLAVFGCIFLMITISEEFIMPVLADSASRLRLTTSLSEMALILAETTSMMLFPFMITFLLVFLVIWEYILGAFAEITCFADRHFYSDWWNSSDWLEFSREWNIPVYHFLRRHVFFSSKTYFSTPVAMTITFLVSALGHELIMGCITKKLRGYGFFAMMLQLPIVALQRSKLVRGRWVLNNAAFWGSMILGLSTMCSLYVLV